MMSKKILIAENALDPTTWESYETEDVCAFLKEHFGVFPDTARIYHGDVCESSDVTPTDAEGVEKLESLEGDFCVVVCPGEVITGVVSIVLAIISIVLAFQGGDAPPPPLLRRQDNSSPNNELSGRQNRERINGRIPDIFGTVRAIPDLIAPNYTLYENNLEVEHSLLCLGKGSY